MRAAIYARVSSKKQEKAESIKSQLHVLHDYVKRQPEWSLAGTYTDDGKSAKTGKLDKRDGFARLMGDAEAKRFDVLVVLDVSRLTRTDSIEERALILGPLQRLGIDIHTPSGGRQDLRSFMGQLYVTLQALVSAEENRKRSEAIRAGKMRAIAEGKKPSGHTVFGYGYDRTTGKWWVDSITGPVVRDIYERIADGQSCGVVAEYLESSGAPRPRGGHWNRERVWQIATNPTYHTGEWVANKGQGLSIAVPTLVETVLWERANRVLRNLRKRGLNRTKHVYLIDAGLARCGLCGGRICVSTGSGPDSGKLRRTYYVCANRRRPPRGVERCQLPFFESAATDERIWASVADLLRRPDLLEAGFAKNEADAQASGEAWRSDLSQVRARLEHLAKSEPALLSQHRRGLISDAAFERELMERKKESAFLERQLATAREASKMAEEQRRTVARLKLNLEHLRQRVDSASPAERRLLVRALMSDAGVVLGSDLTVSTRVRMAEAGDWSQSAKH